MIGLPYFEEHKRGRICRHILLTADRYDGHFKYPYYVYTVEIGLLIY